jgi:hypothetical protein
MATPGSDQTLSPDELVSSAAVPLADAYLDAYLEILNGVGVNTTTDSLGPTESLGPTDSLGTTEVLGATDTPEEKFTGSTGMLLCTSLLQFLNGKTPLIFSVHHTLLHAFFTCCKLGVLPQHCVESTICWNI